jgi:hypothetical protein
MISLRITTFRFRTLVISYIHLKSNFPPPLVGHSYSVIVRSSSPLVNFSSCFSFKFVKQNNANFPIGFGGQVKTSPLLSRILHLSHSMRTLSHDWNIVFDKSRILMHFFVDSTFKTSLRVSSKVYKIFCTTIVLWSK